MTEQIKKASKLLKAGNVVAIPTETVYGLAANVFDEKAVKKIFEIKGRPLFNPLIVHIKSIEELQNVATNIPPKAWILANYFWPGALTLVLPKKKTIPYFVTARKETVGVRVPSHPVALALLEEVDFPLAAPSANPFGYISPTTPRHVYEQLQGAIPFIVDGGNCSIGGHLKIGDGVKIAGMSGVIRDVEPMQVVGGIPAFPIKKWHKMNAILIRMVEGKRGI
jgi:L-threonylcarbamoyladenylate synthase